MTLPVYAGLHLVYGAVMAFASERRMRAEGEVLGWPLVVTLVPVALVSAPMGAVLARFVGDWFFQGVDITAVAIEFERFHLGLLITVGAVAALCTVIGNFAAIAFLSRESRRLALVPVFLGLGIMSTATLIDPMGILEVRPDTPIFMHPAGLCSLAVPVCLAGAYLFARARLSSVPVVSI